MIPSPSPKSKTQIKRDKFKRAVLQLYTNVKCLMMEKLKWMFPMNGNLHNIRKKCHLKYIVNKTLTKRYKLSAIPNMQNILKESEIKHRKF